MSGYDNPKAYYNYSDYNRGNNSFDDSHTVAAGGSSSSSNNNHGIRNSSQPLPSKAYDSNIVHKPDEVTPSSPAGPPPPYSPPPPQSTSSSTDYGTVTVQPGLLDPARSYVDSTPQQYHQQQPQQHHSYQPLAQQPPPEQHQQRPPKWANPHIPRGWQGGDDDEEQQQQHHPPGNGYHRPRSGGESSASRMIRQALQSHSGDDDDASEDTDPGCCKKWCKFLFLAILIWLVVLKYSDTIHFTSPTPLDPSCQASVLWESMPEKINIEKDLWVSVEGHVSTGSVIVHSLPDNSEGSIQTQIHVTPSLMDQLSYELHEGRQTQLTLRLPQNEQGKYCIKVDMEIWLPDKSEQLRVGINNAAVKILDPLQQMDLTDIKTTNGPIEMNDAWEGKRLALQTANADVHVSSTANIEARDTVHLETSNGAIHHEATILSKHYIDLINTNGVVQMGQLRGDDRVHVETSNGEVRIDKVVTDEATITSSNGWVELNHAVVEDSLIVKTSNAPIDIQVENVKNGHTQLTTSNSPVTAHMTSEFEGSILFQTTKVNSINVQDDSDSINFDTNETYMKKGTRIGGKGEFSVMTSNADADIFFDV
ncbi:hypothetical protein BDA99DRAFT_517243 [Phascolomyces articulosus]|uniref:DUF4097 domain-containing protein n=1 Tax=Phascolomyces articulosus TaxID=60185 RepID=A0AAD5JUY4_9FUNG|nr:hypothetical protein BDA99DRAFT_517243 [Phascolomyces articulosus]